MDALVRTLLSYPSMDIAASGATFFFEEDPCRPWSSPKSAFSCEPEDLSRYMEHGRWDLVFNALCYLAGAIEEGTA
jgi:hypothetical protein